MQARTSNWTIFLTTIVAPLERNWPDDHGNSYFWSSPLRDIINLVYKSTEIHCRTLFLSRELRAKDPPLHHNYYYYQYRHLLLRRPIPLSSVELVCRRGLPMRHKDILMVTDQLCESRLCLDYQFGQTLIANQSNKRLRPPPITTILS